MISLLISWAAKAVGEKWAKPLVQIGLPLLIVAAMLGGVWFHGYSNGKDSMRAKLDRTRAELEQCESNYDTVAKAVDRQNAAIEKLGTDAAKAAARVEASVTLAQGVAAEAIAEYRQAIESQSQRHEQELQQLTQGLTTAEACEAIMEWIVQ